MGFDQPISTGFTIHADPTGNWVFAYGTQFPAGDITPPMGAYFVRTDLAARYKWTGTAWSLDSGGGGLTIEDVDAVPSVSATSLQFDSTDGLVLSDLGGGVARVDLSGVPGSVLTNDSVTFAKLPNVSESKLLGRGQGAGAGDTQEITLGAGLTMTGTSLSASAAPAPDQDARIFGLMAQLGF